VGRLDLHLHTTYSDGSFTPSEVVAFAHSANVTALAITDHDTVDGIPEAMEAGQRLGIEIVPGIELSSRWKESEMHILGYFLNRQDPTLHAHLTRFQEARHRRNPRIIERLNELGLEVTYDEVKALAKNESIGRPHIARVLMNKRYVTSAKEAFDRYLADGASAYVPRDLPTPQEAIAIIRAAGGVPVLAHPSWLDRSDGIYKICEELKAHGLAGVEVHYSTHRPEQTAQYLEAARRLELLITGGSDFHGATKPDIEVGRGRGTLFVPEALLEPLKTAAA
jgi:predicted metal-dependent phosphoesterase TrpH